jgi:hypothetical protein
VSERRARRERECQEREEESVNRCGLLHGGPGRGSREVGALTQAYGPGVPLTIVK